MPETLKLVGITKSNITKDENGGNISRLKITEVVLVHCNNVINDYQNSCIHLFSINHFVNFMFSKIFIFFKTFNLEFS